MILTCCASTLLWLFISSFFLHVCSTCTGKQNMFVRHVSESGRVFWFWVIGTCLSSTMFAVRRVAHRPLNSVRWASQGLPKAAPPPNPHLPKTEKNALYEMEVKDFRPPWVYTGTKLVNYLVCPGALLCFCGSLCLTIQRDISICHVCVRLGRKGSRISGGMHPDVSSIPLLIQRSPGNGWNNNRKPSFLYHRNSRSSWIQQKNPPSPSRERVSISLYNCFLSENVKSPFDAPDSHPAGSLSVFSFIYLWKALSVSERPPSCPLTRYACVVLVYPASFHITDETLYAAL